MWFKNLRLYRFTETFTTSHQELNEALAQHEFQPCGSLDQSRYGWVPPLGRHGSEYVHTANGYSMICGKRQEKILPAAVVNEALEERLAQIAQEEGRPVARRERQDLKDEIIFSLMPKAFTRSSLDYAYLSPREDLLVVNAASAKRAEDMLSALREALGSLKVIPVTPVNTPTQVMTHWLNSAAAPTPFELGDECELQSGQDGRVVRCRKLDLTADEIRNHLATGMHVKHLALNWNDAIQCILDEQFAIKRLKFDDAIQSRAQDHSPETAAEEFDIEFSIMTIEISAFVRDLLSAFGGEDRPDKDLSL